MNIEKQDEYKDGDIYQGDLTKLEVLYSTNEVTYGDKVVLIHTGRGPNNNFGLCCNEKQGTVWTVKDIYPAIGIITGATNACCIKRYARLSRESTTPKKATFKSWELNLAEIALSDD